MLWDRCIIDEREKVAKAVIIFCLLLRIKLKPVKSKIADTTGHQMFPSQLHALLV